jgi:hypothetical protein
LVAIYTEGLKDFKKARFWKANIHESDNGEVPEDWLRSALGSEKHREHF